MSLGCSTAAGGGQAGWKGALEALPRSGQLLSQPRTGPARSAAVVAAVFRPAPRSAEKVPRRGRRSDLSCKETFLSPALPSLLGAGRTSLPSLDWAELCSEGLRARGQSSPRLQPGSGGRAEAEAMERMRGFGRVSPDLVSDSLSSLLVGARKGPALPLPPWLSTPAVWQGRGRCRRCQM